MKYIYFQRIRLLKNKIAAELRLINKKALDFKGSMPFLYVNATKVCGVNSLTK